jgi:hypothetical protein
MSDLRTEGCSYRMLRIRCLPSDEAVRFGWVVRTHTWLQAYHTGQYYAPQHHDGVFLGRVHPAVRDDSNEEVDNVESNVELLLLKKKGGNQ